MIDVILVDRSKLPQAMLGEVKSYARVFHCDDDEQILLLIGSAIDRFEIREGMTIHPAQYLWTVESEFDSNGRMPITPERRISPISAWIAEAVVDDAMGDVTASYSLIRAGLSGVSFYWLAGASQTGLQLTLTAGYADAPLMPAAIRHRIAKAAATFYEYREEFTPANLERHPSVDNVDGTGYWIPSV